MYLYVVNEFFRVLSKLYGEYIMNEVERVKQICKERKIAISRLEKACGFSNGYIRSLKEGKMPSDRLYAVSVFLELPMEYLVTGTETPTDGLTASERELLSLFRSLSSTGQSAALTMLAGLQNNPEFVKEKNQNIQVG